MSDRSRRDRHAVRRKNTKANAEFGTQARVSNRHAVAKGATSAKLTAGRAAMLVPATVHRRTWNFIRHYWKLFQFARGHIGTRRLMLVAFLGMTAAVARGGILFFAAKFAQLMQDHEIHFYGLSLSAGNTLTALIIFSIPVLLLLLYGSFASYRAATYMRACGRTTREQLARVFLTNARWLDRAMISDIAPNASSLRQFFGRDLVQTGISVELMLRLIQPTAYIVLALGGALYLEPILSAILLAIASVTLPAFYLLIRRIQANSLNLFQRLIRESSGVVASLIERLQGANVGQASRVDADWLEQQPVYREYLDSYDRMKLASSYMTLRASLLISVLIVCGFLAFGWLAIEGDRSWSDLVIYIGALVLFASGLQSFLSTLAVLIKYYPQTRRAADLIERLEAASKSGVCAPEPPTKITFNSKKRIVDSEPHRTVEQGDLSILLTNKPLRRLSFQQLLRPLRRASDAPAGVWDTASFLAYATPLTNGTVAQSVLGERNTESQRAWLEEFLVKGLGPSYPKLFPEGLSTELTEARWNALPQHATETLALASACVEAHAVLFVDSDVAAMLPAEIIESLPRTQDVRYAFIVGSKLNSSIPADHYIVIDDKHIVGLGDASWLEAQQVTIAPLVSRGKRDEEDDELLEEDF